MKKTEAGHVGPDDVLKGVEVLRVLHAESRDRCDADGRMELGGIHRDALKLLDYFAALHADTVARPASNHPDDEALDRFADALKVKLAEARAKGRGGWTSDELGMQQRLSDMLRAHVEKGDPRDVANFCMFLHQRGEAILPARAASPAGVPDMDRQQMAAAIASLKNSGRHVRAGVLLEDLLAAASSALIERLEASNWRLANLLALIPEGRFERAQIEQDMADNRAALAASAQGQSASPAGVPDGAVEVLRQAICGDRHTVSIMFDAQESADRFYAHMDEAMKIAQNASAAPGAGTGTDSGRAR